MTGKFISSGGRSCSVGSVLGSLSCLMQWRGFDPPLGRFFFAGRGDFFLGVTMGSDCSPQKLFRVRVKGLVCAHMDSVARIQKILTFVS